MSAGFAGDKRCGAKQTRRGRLLLVLAVATAAGCTSMASPGAANVRDSIVAANPGCHLERESRVSLGGLKLAIVKSLARLSGEPEAARVLPHIRRVEVETYNILVPTLCNETSWMEVLGETMTERGWWAMVIEREDAESSWAFAHGDETGDLDGLLVVEFGGDELEVVRVDGRLDRLFAEALVENAGETGRMARGFR